MENTVQNQCVSNLNTSFARVFPLENVSTGLITDTDSLHV